MSSPRRHSPAVYRRRRLVALLSAILLVAAIAAGVWLVVAQPWQNAGSPQPAASPTATDGAVVIPAPSSGASAPTAEPSAEASAEPVDPAVAPSPGATEPVIEACEREDVTVEPVLDNDSYGEGQLPQMSIRLTNVSESDCAMNVGTTHQVFTVSSGPDVWWTSTDCQKEPSDMIVPLAAGQVVERVEHCQAPVAQCDNQISG